LLREFLCSLSKNLRLYVHQSSHVTTLSRRRHSLCHSPSPSILFPRITPNSLPRTTQRLDCAPHNSIRAFFVKNINQLPSNDQHIVHAGIRHALRRILLIDQIRHPNGCWIKSGSGGRDLVRALHALYLSSLRFPRISPKLITSHYPIHHLAKLACAARRSVFHGGHQPKFQPTIDGSGILRVATPRNAFFNL